MKACIVDERDVNVECPLPMFRVTVWHDDAHVTTWDIEAASVSEVLQFTRSPACEDAMRVEVTCKVRLDSEHLATVLLETIED